MSVNDILETAGEAMVSALDGITDLFKWAGGQAFLFMLYLIGTFLLCILCTFRILEMPIEKAFSWIDDLIDDCNTAPHK